MAHETKIGNSHDRFLWPGPKSQAVNCGVIHGSWVTSRQVCWPAVCRLPVRAKSTTNRSSEYDRDFLSGYQRCAQARRQAKLGFLAGSFPLCCDSW